MSEMDMETPQEDAAEQQQDAGAASESATNDLIEVPDEVDEADAAEQTRDVGYDDDDYR